LLNVQQNYEWQMRFQEIDADCSQVSYKHL